MTMTTNGGDVQPTGRRWRWTFVAGVVTIVLALISAVLPALEWAPRAGLVGWLLVLAGAAEFAFGGGQRRDRLGAAAMISGLITSAAGLIFVVDSFAGYFPVANLVMLWLFLRGLWVLATGFSLEVRQTRAWFLLSGLTDMVLGLVLAAALPVAILVVTLFGSTPAIVAKFSLILTISFLVTGTSQVRIALIQRRMVDHSS